MPLKIAEERIMPPPFPEVVADAGGWTIGSTVAEADDTAATGSIGAGGRGFSVIGYQTIRSSRRKPEPSPAGDPSAPACHRCRSCAPCLAEALGPGFRRDERRKKVVLP